MNESIKSILSKEIIEEIETAEQNAIGNPDAHWTLYIHIVPKELSGYDWDKYYVGITGQQINLRWRDGRGYKDQVFNHCIEKYGWKNIKHVVISNNLIEQEACEFEINIIFYLKCFNKRYGYNVSYGGKGCSYMGRKVARYDLQGNLIDTFLNPNYANNILSGNASIYKSLKNTNSISHGSMWRYYDDKPLQKIEPYCGRYHDDKRIKQFGLDGTSIKVWNTIKEASLAYKNGEIKNIRKSCDGKYETAYGSQWRYYDDNRPVLNLTTYFDNVIYRYSNDGKYIRKYDNVQELKKYFKNNQAVAIYRRTKDSKYEYAIGYNSVWSFIKKDVIEIIKRCGRPVAKINIENNEILDIFISSVDAAKNINGDNSTILRCCKGQCKTAYNYLWKYIENIDISNIKDEKLLSQYYMILGIINK